MRFQITKFVALFSAVSALLLVSVPAASAAPGDWQPGPGGVLDNTYAGVIDMPASGATVPGSGSFIISGWFVDKTAQGWAGADDVQVWLGTMDGGGKMLAKAAFAQSRPDVAASLSNPYDAASGFGAVIAGSAVPSGSQTLNVYAHTGGKGWWFKGVTVTGGGAATGNPAPAPSAPSAPAAPAAPSSGAAPVVAITSPTENQNVTTKSDFVITGSTSEAPSIDRIDVWIGGERDAPGGRELGTTTPGSDGSWSMTFTPTHFASTHQNLYVYSHNKTNNLETEATRGFNIVDHT